MKFLLILAAVALQQAAHPVSEGATRSAIWNDLQLNAFIGNGNKLASWDWVLGHENDYPPTLTITDLKCGDGPRKYKCTFGLLREANRSAPLADKAEAPRLKCSARFKWSSEDEAWAVVHYPPEGGGHSLTSMKCKRG